MKPIHLTTSALLAALLMGFSGCDSDSDDTPGTITEPGESDIAVKTVDATDYDNYAYFSLASGTVVTASDNWDLAFKRTEFIMNGGDSGSKGVQMALAHTPDGFYDGTDTAVEATFLSALPEDYLEVIGTIAADDNLTAFGSDVFTPAIPAMTTTETDGWYYYCGSNPEQCDSAQIAAHKIVPNEDTWYLVRSAEATDGNYTFAKVHVTGIDYLSSSAERNVTLEMYVQPGTDNTFGAATVTAVLNTLPNSETCYHIATNTVNDCSGAWDIKHKRIGNSSSLRLNGGASGTGDAAGSQLDASDLGKLASGTDLAANVQEMTSSYYWTQDVTASDYGKYSATYGWGWYKSSKIYPNYRVYLLDDGEGKTYALQISSYYHPETLTSANITLRYTEVE